MTTFAYKDGRPHVVHEDGSTTEFKMPGHADSIIAALEAHGDGVKPVVARRGKHYQSDEEFVELELPRIKRGGYRPSQDGHLNEYLIDRGVERGLLIRDAHGALSLNREMVALRQEFNAWMKQRHREATAARKLAREWEQGAGRSE